MKSAYTYIAWLIALEVLVQAASIAYGVFGMEKWVEDGHSATKSSMESAHYAGAGGFTLHGINGEIAIVVLGIILLVVAFLSKIPRATVAAGTLLAMIVVQVVLGLVSSAVPVLGALHGILALLVFAYAAMIGVRVMLAGKRSAAPVA
ncbi:MAG: hypothetical protein ACR2FG_12695 [Marmoricola sp.]